MPSNRRKRARSPPILITRRYALRINAPRDPRDPPKVQSKSRFLSRCIIKPLQTTYRKRRSDSPDAESEESESDEDSDSEPDYEEYFLAARAVTRCVDMFCNVNKVIKVILYVRQEEAASKGELEEDPIQSAKRKEYLRSM